MIGGLVALALVYVCGYVGAALALRDLDAGRRLPVGPSYRVYLAYQRAWTRFFIHPSRSGELVATARSFAPEGESCVESSY